MNTLIDRITVSERVKGEDGEIKQSIKIYYKFVGNLHEHYIKATKFPVFIPEKPCCRCGIVYQPNSNVAKYCPDCAEVAHRESLDRANQRRMIKRGGRKLIPKQCECCGVVFIPKSHNSRYCEECAPEARKTAGKQWSSEYYQQQKVKKGLSA